MYEKRVRIYEALGMTRSDAQAIVDKEFTELEKTCAHCGEPLYTLVRAHAHTEKNVDVTK